MNVGCKRAILNLLHDMFGNAISEVVITADQATILSADKAKSAQSQTKNYIFSNIIDSKLWERNVVVKYFIVLKREFAWNLWFFVESFKMITKKSIYIFDEKDTFNIVSYVVVMYE